MLMTPRRVTKRARIMTSTPFDGQTVICSTPSTVPLTDLSPIREVSLNFVMTPQRRTSIDHLDHLREFSLNIVESPQRRSPTDNLNQLRPSLENDLLRTPTRRPLSRNILPVTVPETPAWARPTKAWLARQSCANDKELKLKPKNTNHQHRKPHTKEEKEEIWRRIQKPKTNPENRQN